MTAAPGKHSITQEMLDQMFKHNPIEGHIWAKMIQDGRAVLTSTAQSNTTFSVPGKCPA